METNGRRGGNTELFLGERRWRGGQQMEKATEGFVCLRRDEQVSVCARAAMNYSPLIKGGEMENCV